MQQQEIKHFIQFRRSVGASSCSPCLHGLVVSVPCPGSHAKSGFVDVPISFHRNNLDGKR
jgi:hypothetical protein